MTPVNPPLRHLAWFEALAETEETAPDWPALSAGLLILRALDRMDEHPGALELGMIRRDALEDAVNAVPANHPHRIILHNLLASLSQSLDPFVPGVNGRLLAFGTLLQGEGRWALAVDVYDALVARTPPDDSDLAIAGWLAMASCLRTLGRLDEAVGAYEAAQMLAEEFHRPGDETRATIGLGNVALQRGNLPRAERLLEEALAQARAGRDVQNEAAARHDLGHVAYRRGDRVRAARLFHAAFELYSEEHRKDRALADLASTLGELGHRGGARDANLILSVTAQEPYLRWAAAINLMEISIEEGSEPLFEEHRKSLREVALPPDLSAHYHLRTARGHRRFGRPSQADAAYGRAVAIAEAHGLGQLLLVAEQERAAASVEVRQQRAPDPEVVDIVQTVQRLRAQTVPA